MAFFVFYGKVQVTVNDNVFRISKGGMWQVPRGKTDFWLIFPNAATLMLLIQLQGIFMVSKMIMTNLLEYFSHKGVKLKRQVRHEESQNLSLWAKIN